jgi:DNA-binding beta-propeller fold protein YncE
MIKSRSFFCFKRLVILFAIIFLLIPAVMSLTGCANAPAKIELPKGQYAWPMPPATPKIKWVAQWSNRYDFGRPSRVLEFMVGKERVEELRRPDGVVADRAGSVYVADSEMHMVFVFDKEKNALRFLGIGTLAAPTGLAMDDDRRVLYVSDSRLKKVFGIDTRTGDLVMSLGGPGEFRNPAGMAFNQQKGWLYVADSHGHVVKVFDRQGHALFTVGKRGDGNGEFNFPTYVALDKAGNLYVVDSFNFRVQIFDADGKFIRKFGKLGDASGFFSRPAGIGVDSEGHIYVVDSAFNNFQIFNKEGQLLLWVGNAGTRPGEFYLPSGMYIDSTTDKIYVADTFNRRVQVFQYLRAQAQK